MIVFPESPIYLDTFASEDNRVCALTGDPVQAPYMAWLSNSKNVPDFFVSGRAVTRSNVLDHVADALAGRGAWERIDKCHPDVIADLLALASAHHGGLPQHSVIGQTHNARELPSAARMPVGPRTKRKRTFTSP